MNFLERIGATQDILLHYYPLHSALADWGKDLESHLSEWIINHPDAYQESIVPSLEAGCDIISTSTQAASPWRAAVFGLRDRIHEYNYHSARLAREVVPEGRYLAGFVSDTNPDFLEPLGSLTAREVKEGYKEQISVLLEGGVDLIMIVGNHLEEKLIAIQAAKNLSNKPVVAQNVFYQGAMGFRTMMGLDPIEASARLEDSGVDVIGASCGLMKREEDAYAYYEGATALLLQMRKGTGKPLSIQPNAGMARLVNGHTVYPASPLEMANEVPNWIAAGARILGGCCGTSLEHYRAIRPIVDTENERRRTATG